MGKTREKTCLFFCISLSSLPGNHHSKKAISWAKTHSIKESCGRKGNKTRNTKGKKHSNIDIFIVTQYSPFSWSCFRIYFIFQGEDKEVGGLIQMCWQNDRELRPSSHQICGAVADIMLR